MAESVNIPVNLEVTDISLDKVDLKDVEQKLGQKVSGIVKSIESIMSNTDTSKFNKALSSSFNSMKKSYNSIQTAQARYNDAMRKAGESSQEYKSKLSEVKSEMKVVQDGWNAFNDVMGKSYADAKNAEAAGTMSPTSSYARVIQMYEKEMAEYEQRMNDLQSKMPNPIDYVSKGSEGTLIKVTQSYSALINAITNADKAQQDWNTSLKENRASDEYMKMAQEIQTAEQKLAKLQEKAAKMEVLGASDKQWESLIYDANLLSKSITDNESKMRKLVNTGKAFRFGNGGSAKGQEFMKLTSIIVRVEKAMNRINGMKPNTMYTDEYSKQVRELEALERKLISYRDKYQKMQTIGATGNQWKTFLTDASILEGKIEEIIGKLQEMVQTGKAFKLGTGDAAAESDALDERLSNLIGTFKEMQGSPKNTKVQVMGLIKVINSFCNSAKKGIASVISMFKKLGKSSKHTHKDMSKSLKRITKNLITFAFGVRSIYMLLRRLRTTFINSFKEMAAQIPEINTQISSFMTSLNQLKGSLATAFQPLVSAIIPWLNQFCAALNNAMNSLARFFATLTGQGYIYKFTAAQVDYAESLDKTSGSAKDAQKSLMGFDEINRLNGDNDSGAGSGSDEAPIGSWEKETLDGMNKLAQLIKEAWTDGDFTEVGQYIGEKLLNSLKVANNWITTKGYALANKIGKSLATLINGTISTEGLGDNLGKTIANSINMAMIGIHKLFTTTNWLNLGQFIADWANSSVKNFNWSLLGQTIASIITAAINTWWKFVGEFNFKALGTGISTAINNLLDTALTVDETGLSGAEKLGQSISNTVNGILTTLITIIKQTNWEEVGRVIGEVLGSIDWGKIVWNLGALVYSFIKGLETAFLEWAETDPLSAAIASMLGLGVVTLNLGASITGLLLKLKPLVDMFGGLDKVITFLKGTIGTVSKVLGGITLVITGIVMALTNFFSMLKNGFSWVKEILMVIGIALAAVGAIILGAPALVVAVIAAIVAAVATLVVVIKDNWQAICDFFVNAWNWAVDKVTSIIETLCDWWTTVWTAIKTFFVNLWNGIIQFITTAFTLIKTTITTILTAIKTVWTTIWTTMKNLVTRVFNGIKTVVTTVFTAIKTSITNVLNGIKTFWTTVWNGIKSVVTTVWNGIKSVITTVSNSIKTNVVTALNTLKTQWSTIWNSFKTIVSNIWNGIWTVIKGVINTIIGGINGMVKGVVSGLNAMIGAMNKLSFDIPDWVPSYGGEQFGFSIPKLTAPQIPYLAKGAVIPPNKEFMAVLGDQKNGTNIEAPLDTIKQAVAEELAEYIDAMMTGFQAVVQAVNDKDFDVTIGDNAIGKAAERYNRRQALIRGTT